MDTWLTAHNLKPRQLYKGQLNVYCLSYENWRMWGPQWLGRNTTVRAGRYVRLVSSAAELLLSVSFYSDAWHSPSIIVLLLGCIGILTLENILFFSSSILSIEWHYCQGNDQTLLTKNHNTSDVCQCLKWGVSCRSRAWCLWTPGSKWRWVAASSS